MIPRTIRAHIEDLLRRHPAVVLTGPRGSGKTTLARSLSDVHYDIEQDQEITRLDIEWLRRMRGRELVILDEIQRMPELFLRLRATIDEQRSRTGRFLMTESFASPLIKSLEGRYALCELPLLLASEVPETAWDALWAAGGYPENFGALDPFPVWQQAYLERIVQRDLPNGGFPAPPLVAERLLRMLALAHGQPWNASQIAKSLGISYHTVNTYVSFLERAHLVRRLPASTLQIRKRLVKSPKFYWRDTGLLHTLRGLTDTAHLYAQPWVGASWEGWVIEQIIGHLQTGGHRVQAAHFCTSDQYALDLLLTHQGKRWGMNISISSAPDAGMLERLGAAARLAGADRAILVSRVAEPIERGDAVSLNLAGTLETLGVGASRGAEEQGSKGARS
jgi:predicted AAA+ superfamily ATPase